MLRCAPLHRVFVLPLATLALVATLAESPSDCNPTPIPDSPPVGSHGSPRACEGLWRPS